jgi:DNA-binding MarR family transcriptional regulator
VLLAVHKKMTLVELERFTGLGRSSLGNHLQKLEAAGYVETKVVRTFMGRRQLIEITKEGLEVCRTLLNTIRRIRF